MPNRDGKLLLSEPDLIAHFGKPALDAWRANWREEAQNSYGGGKAAKLRQTILDILKYSEEPVKSEKIAKISNRAPGYISKVMRAMEKNKLVSVVFLPRNKKTKYYTSLRVK